MANSNAEYGKSIKWGNVKRIEVDRQVLDGWFYQMKEIKQELEHIRIMLSNTANEQKQEIDRLRSEVDVLNKKLKKHEGS